MPRKNASQSISWLPATRRKPSCSAKRSKRVRPQAEKSCLLRTGRELLAGIAVGQLYSVIPPEHDPAALLEAGEDTAHCLGRQAEIVSDVSTCHRKVDEIRFAAKAFLATSKGKQEGRDPLMRRLAAEQHHLLLRRGELVRRHGIHRAAGRADAAGSGRPSPASALRRCRRMRC